MGVHPFGDPRIVDEFAAERVDVDVREFHGYAAEWTPEQVAFFVDGELVKTVHQSPSLPDAVHARHLRAHGGPCRRPAQVDGRLSESSVVDSVPCLAPLTAARPGDPTLARVGARRARMPTWAPTRELPPQPRGPRRVLGRRGAGIDWRTEPTTVLDASRAPFYRWFPDGELNTCDNALDRHVAAGTATGPR